MFGFGRTDRSPVNPVVLRRDATGAPAINLEKVRQGGHIALVKAADEAGVALAARNLSGVRAQAVAVLDHSLSMKADFRRGAVQLLLTRLLGFSLQIDADGKVPIVPFDDFVRPVVTATIDNYTDIVERHIWQPDNMGSTNMAQALEVVRDMAAVTEEPMFVTVLGDGNPNSFKDTTKVVADLARYPVFLKFAALRPVDYLDTLDNLTDRERLLDNCNAQPRKGSGLDLLSCSDAQFQAAMVEEWDLWITRALAAGVLKR